MENYLEYYHLPAVHPELCDVSGVDEHRRNQGRGMYMSFATEPLSKGGTPIDPGRIPPFPTLRPRHHEMAYHVAIFPNTFFSVRERLDSTRLDSTRLDPTRLDATRLDSTRLDSTRLDSTRLDSTRLDLT